jgi:hypothetical protein
MRTAITDQMWDFKDKARLKSGGALCCSTCAALDNPKGTMQVDHVHRFVKLRSDFMAINAAPVPEAFCRGRDGRPRIGRKFYAFRDSWQEYHRAHAKLRLLCASCHHHETHLQNVSEAESGQ